MRVDWSQSGTEEVGHDCSLFRNVATGEDYESCGPSLSGLAKKCTNSGVHPALSMEKEVVIAFVVLSRYRDVEAETLGI